MEGLYAAIGMGIQDDFLPYDVDLLRAIILSLLQRLRSLSPIYAREATEVLMAITIDDLIGTIAPPAMLTTPDGVSKVAGGLGRIAVNPSLRRHLNVMVRVLRKKNPNLAKLLRPESRQSAETEYRYLLQLLARPDTNGKGKHRLALSRQWSIGIASIRATGYSGSIEDRKHWAHENFEGLYILLRSIVCRNCDYPSPLKSLVDRAIDCTTPESFLREVLAHMHRTTSASIDKLLQPSRYRSS